MEHFYPKGWLYEGVAAPMIIWLGPRFRQGARVGWGAISSPDPCIRHWLCTSIWLIIWARFIFFFTNIFSLYVYHSIKVWSNLIKFICYENDFFPHFLPHILVLMIKSLVRPVIHAALTPHRHAFFSFVYYHNCSFLHRKTHFPELLEIIQMEPIYTG